MEDKLINPYHETENRIDEVLVKLVDIYSKELTQKNQFNLDFQYRININQFIMKKFDYGNETVSLPEIKHDVRLLKIDVANSIRAGRQNKDEELEVSALKINVALNNQGTKLFGFIIDLNERTYDLIPYKTRILELKDTALIKKSLQRIIDYYHLIIPNMLAERTNVESLCQ